MKAERGALIVVAEQAGKDVNALREKLLAMNYPFVAGVVRAAEESLLVAYNMLADAKESDL